MKKRERNRSTPRDERELKLLKKISQKVHKSLHDTGEPVEWLAWESDTSRATVRRVFDANRNLGILTLDRIAYALGYKDGVIGLLNDL